MNHTLIDDTNIRTLDARRLLCPLPVIRAQKVINDLAEGDVLQVLATDPGVMHDIPAWCRLHGHTVASAEKVANEFHIYIQIGQKQTGLIC